MIASKWKKHLVLSKHSSISPYLPKTYLYSQTKLLKALRRHSIIFLKPVNGTGGSGVIRIKYTGKTFVVHHRRQKKQVKNEKSLFSMVESLFKGRDYLVQRGIHLVKIDKRPIDYRLLVLRPRSSWKIMGIMGKWAAKDKIVTNHCQGGSPISLWSSLKKSLGLHTEEREEIEKKIEKIGMKIAHSLGDAYGMRQLGIDIGIDDRQRIWILEVNTAPRYQLFRYHRDKNLYQKIADYMSTIKKKSKRSRH